LSIFQAYTFIFGTIVGSFLNVCIYRIPVGRSIVSPPSSCPQCGHLIHWYENIPVFSYLFLAGKCSSCKAKIPLRYPAIELLTGVLFAGVFSAFGLSSATIVYSIFVASLVVITFIDLDHQIIPDIISLPGIIIGFVCSFFIPWLSWQDSLFGILCGGGVLFGIAGIYQLLTKREGMGGGDIKLLGMLGAFLGWKSILPIIFLASLVGTLVGIPLMMIRKDNVRLAIPFGPFLALAATGYLFFGQDIVSWYLGLMHR